MARALLIMASNVLVFILISSVLRIQAREDLFARPLNPGKLRLGLGKAKLRHLHFYMHNSHRTRNTTVLTVVKPPINLMAPGAAANMADGPFGTINMIDSPLTEGPDRSSELVGRAQGLYGQASLEGTGLLMVITYAFLQGKYNGSSISVVGRQNIYTKVRQMPVVGGSGVFRFAGGYVEASTYHVDNISGDVIIEFNVYVKHY